MTDNVRNGVVAKPSPTNEALLAAAMAEFNAHGFGGTDTNRIARAAGFAPQTFYRHFKDKTEIFIRVYERWQENERANISAAMHAAADPDAQLLSIAAVLIETHRSSAHFRRSLRHLAVEDGRVRTARAASRRAQLAALAPALRPGTWASQVAALLTIERLCDAAADGETDDLAIADSAWLPVVSAAVAALRRG